MKIFRKYKFKVFRFYTYHSVWMEVNVNC